MRAEFPAELEFLFEAHRYKVLYSGRGAAKSWGVARALLILGAQQRIRILCARETQKSIAESVHALLRDQIYLLGLEAKYTIQQAEIIGSNGTTFFFAGLKHNINNIKSVEACDIVWVEEAQVVSKQSWEVLIPTIRKEKSEIWVTFNPELDTDDTYRRFVTSPPPNSKVVRLNYKQNPWFPEVLRVEMEHLKLTDDAAYRHVWEGETRSMIEGAIYAYEIKQATEQGRITQANYDRTQPVHTFWDLGFGDKTAVWFAQCVGGWFNVIDYMENSQRPIEWYVVQMQQKQYQYGTDWLPHDSVDTIIHAKLAGGDKSRSIEMLLRNAGRNVRVAPKMYVADGINAVRTVFPQLRFDAERCADGLQGIRHYQWGPPAASGQERRAPLHNWASHPADALRTLATCIKHPAPQLEPKASRPPMVVTQWS